MSAAQTTDVIDALAGVEPGSRLDQIRARRPQARLNAQASYGALFAPADAATFGLTERHAVASFVADLHRRPAIAAFYGQRLADAALAEAIAHEAGAGATEGPYGAYPPGPLTPEDRAGFAYRVAPENRTRFGSRLTAALEHAHMLVFHPRDADPEALQALIEAGLSTTDIVTLSQLVAFLAFQIRVVDGLRVLAATARGEAA